jgi:hypothetical protein
MTSSLDRRVVISGKVVANVKSTPLGSRRTKPGRSISELSLMNAVAASNATSGMGLAGADMQAARQLVEA